MAAAKAAMANTMASTIPTMSRPKSAPLRRRGIVPTWLVTNRCRGSNADDSGSCVLTLPLS
jgi:hypothetical protein